MQKLFHHAPDVVAVNQGKAQLHRTPAKRTSVISSYVSIHLFSCTFWNIAYKKKIYKKKNYAGRKREDGHEFKKCALKKTCAHLSRIKGLSDMKNCA